MHELLLFASVPAHQHHELLQQLAGLTAMQPRHRVERRLIFKAHRQPGMTNTRVGASQDLQGAELQRLNKMLNGGMFYTQVVGPVAKAEFGAKPASASSGGADVSMSGMEEKPSTAPYSYEDQPWKLEFRDIPEAGTRSAVTARLMASAVLPKGDITVPMNAWGYSFVSEYVVEGDVFVLNDIVIFMHRVLLYPTSGVQESHGPRRQLPAYRELSPLERTGSYVLQAAITVQDGANQEMMKTASQHLFGLREQLKSAVRLEQADRLSLDPRAK
ncbi:putative RNA polymerase II mediator complex subunit Srb5 [Aspergillus heteromorphus CBS 117.55]|uniref:Mediator of RNA polymerase II transcription subunit 18 n=1 Tax=Aspergillus heteromorphus CBS 117.55 TaxID=1448321 RepID=A0A317VWB3_9EURO|nr:putative RNA polymerase II mediator complex subunit Srb5 [Aspergillus heteromorphus CBS 117.55]PWY76210.1 putative RNA polymerase II mediator complex subunit Srb5 [Aspergillus heteromorphus CBS 117.55]